MWSLIEFYVYLKQKAITGNSQKRKFEVVLIAMELPNVETVIIDLKISTYY